MCKTLCVDCVLNVSMFVRVWIMVMAMLKVQNIKEYFVYLCLCWFVLFLFDCYIGLSSAVFISFCPLIIALVFSSQGLLPPVGTTYQEWIECARVSVICTNCCFIYT